MFCFSEKPKIWSALGLAMIKMPKKGTNKVRLEPYIVEKSKIKYGWGVILLKMIK